MEIQKNRLRADFRSVDFRFIIIESE